MTRRLLTLGAVDRTRSPRNVGDGARAVDGSGLAAMGGTHPQLHVGLEGIGVELAGGWTEEALEPRARRRAFVHRGGGRSPLHALSEHHEVAAGTTHQEAVAAFDAGSGKTIWEFSLPRSRRWHRFQSGLRAALDSSHRWRSRCSQRAHAASSSRSTKGPASRFGHTTWSRSTVPFPLVAVTPAARSSTTASSSSRWAAPTRPWRRSMRRRASLRGRRVTSCGRPHRQF